MLIYFVLLILIFKTIYTLVTYFTKNISKDFPNNFINPFSNKIEYIIPDNKNEKNSLYQDSYNKPFNININKPFIKSSIPYIVKLEMRTNNIKKMNDDMKHIAYHNTTVDLIKEFHAITGIVVDNCILLIFSYDNELFKGSIDKLNSVIASYASSMLTLKLNKPCSFFSQIIQFYNMSRNHNIMHNYMHYIKNIYTTNITKNITPYFIKRIKDNNNNKYIKFTLNRIKLNNNYYKLFFI